MSQPLENITGWEIQPYVPKVSDYFHPKKEAALHAKLYKLLRQTVSKSVSKLKSISPSENWSTSNEIVEAVPLSFKVPEDSHVNTMRLEMLIAEAQRLKKQRTRTSLVGEIYVSFKLPEDFVMSGMDMNKIAKPQDRRNMSTTNYKNGCQFSLSERLEGWKVERRQRSNGRYDLYYRHGKSKASFRSTIEVVNFLLYEAHSDTHGPPNDRKSEENSPVEKRDDTKKSSSVKRNLSSALKSESSKKTKDHKSVDIGCENTRSSSMKENWSNLNLGSPCKTKESFSSHGRRAVEKVETLEELISSDYIANNNNNNNFVHCTTSISQSDDDESKQEFKEYSMEFPSESIDMDDEGITPQMVMQFLESAHNNLLNYFNKEVEVPKVMCSSENKRKRTEAYPPAKDDVDSTKLETSCIKIKEDNRTDEVVINNPVVVDQTTPPVDDIAKVEVEVEVEVDPTADVVANNPAVVNASSSVQVEDNKGHSLVVLPSYNEQCDLINHIPRADMLDLIYRDIKHDGDH